MTTAYTSLLGLALPVTGELSGTWGDVVNNSITSLLDSAIAGTTNVSTDGDVTLTTTTGAANTAREAILLFSGARTALRTVTAPAQSKVYTVINATTGGYSVKLVGSGPTTGLTIPNGASAVVAWNGSDFVEVGAGSIGNLIVNGTLTVTGATTLQSTLAVTGNITNTAGTANGVTYLNGSKVLTSGSALTFDGTNLLVGSGTAVSLSGYTMLSQAKGSFGIVSGNDEFAGAILRESSSTNSISIQADPANLRASSFLGFGVDGSEQMRLTSTGLGIGTSSPSGLLTLNKSSGAYSLNLDGGGYGTLAKFGVVNVGTDNSSYIGTISNNNFLIKTYNSTVATFDTSGNLGLGVTPSAWSVLKSIDIAATGSVFATTAQAGIANNAYFNGTNWIYKTSTNATFFRATGSAFEWHTAASGTAGNAITFTQAMTLDASGNLGIGTSSPATKLHVVGAGLFAGGSSNTLGVTSTSGSALLNLNTTGTGGRQFYIYASDNTNGISGGRLSFEDASTGNRMVFDGASGNLGLGITPQSQDSTYKAISIAAASNANYWSLAAHGAAAAEGNTLWNAKSSGNETFTYMNTGDLASRFRQSGYFSWHVAPTGTAGNAITFTQAMTLTAGGNLGLGTTSPSAVSNYVAMTINGTSGSFTDYSQNGTVYMRVGADSSSAFISDGGAGSSIRFLTSSAERMRLDSSGNLGLGVTPSAWSSGKAFEIGGAGQGIWLSGGNDLYYNNNAYYNSGWKYGLSGNYATSYRQVNGQHIWSNAPSGTAGTAITFTQAMTLDAGGLLHVGETAHTDGSMFQNSGTALNAYRPSTNAGQGILGLYSDTGGTKTVRAYFKVDGGLANYSANDVNLSDERLKKDIALAGSYLDKICAIPVKNFRYKDQSASEDITLGVIAQDVLAVAPELVSQEGFGLEGKEDFLSVYQTDLQYALMKCIQEQQAIIDSLKARLDAANL